MNKLLKAIVLYGPPSIGKSTYLREEIRKHPNAQILSVDKDIINGHFFKPQLVKNNTPQSPTTLLWKTTSHLVEQASKREWLDVLTSQGKKDLVVVLQGVTLGGVQQDIETLLNSGFDVRVTLLATDSIDLLKFRIDERARQPGYIGAPSMTVTELEEISKNCYKGFGLMLSGDAGLKGISYEAFIIGIGKAGSINIKTPIQTSYFSQDKLSFRGNSLLFGDADSPAYSLQTA